MFLKVCYGDNTWPKTMGEVSATFECNPHRHGTPKWIQMSHPSKPWQIALLVLPTKARILCLNSS
jgi:hypothetical protein